jgi:peptidoglycan/LPS O-acetylase OafA/YrhL
MKYLKELDSLRAIAVLLVITSHWILPYLPVRYVPNGAIGVDIFFVLSGFLITWILLANRLEGEIQQVDKSRILKNFYIRRTLRIFPIYYIVVILLLIFSESTDSSIGTSYPYFFTYTSNFYFFNTGKWDGVLSHLWSLAVEEQFYLLWPSLMLFVGRKYLPYIIYCFIATGLISQFILRNNELGNVFTTTCFDAFGAGALLAWYLVFAPQKIAGLYKVIKVIAIVAFIVFVDGLIQSKGADIPMQRALISAMVMFIITHIIYKGPQGKLRLSFIWHNRTLIFLGKISYGIYLYHNIVPHYTAKVVEGYFGFSIKDGLPYKMGYFLMLGVNSIILLALAWGSWILIEKPILSLKKYFNYMDTRKSPIPSPTKY